MDGMSESLALAASAGSVLTVTRATMTALALLMHRDLHVCVVLLVFESGNTLAMLLDAFEITHATELLWPAPSRLASCKTVARAKA